MPDLKNQMLAITKKIFPGLSVLLNLSDTKE
jgi:hypothetical protein